MDSTSTSSLGDPANSPVLPGCAWTRGPPYSAISAGFAEMIGLRHNREDVVEFADGQRESVVIVEVRLRIGEREAPTLAIHARHGFSRQACARGAWPRRRSRRTGPGSGSEHRAPEPAGNARSPALGGTPLTPPKLPVAVQPSSAGDGR